MKAMVLTKTMEIDIREVPDPKIQNPDEVFLKIIKVGVCGSDIHYYSQGRIGDQVIEFPFTIGHECSAVVERVGADVTRVKPGDLVAVDPSIACYECDQCKAGRYHTCRNGHFLSVPGQISGCMSEYIVMPEACCYKVSDKISAEQAVLVEPLTIGFWAVELGGDNKNKNAGILGVGPIGLSVLQGLQIAGAGNVYVTDKLDYRLDIAREQGAVWIGNPDKIDIVEQIEENEPLLLDVVYECCGDQEAINQGVDLLKPGGKLVLVGIPDEDQVYFDISKLRRQEIEIINVRRQNECVATVIEAIESGKIKPDFMLTHQFSLDDIDEAFKTVHGYKDGVVKAVIRMD